MSQNLIQLQLDDARMGEIGAAMSALEAALQDLIALDSEEFRGLPRMGPKSEQFCRETLSTGFPK